MLARRVLNDVRSKPLNYSNLAGSCWLRTPPRVKECGPDTNAITAELDASENKVRSACEGETGRLHGVIRVEDEGRAG